MRTILNNKHIHSDYIPQLFLGFLFLLTIFLTFSPFFKIGLTNCDDIEYYLRSLMGKTDSDMYAQHAGRFYFLITKPLYHLAYMFDNFYLTKVIQYGFLLLSFILFAVVIKKIFKHTNFALSVFLLLLVFLTVTPNYNIAIIAYPFYFTFSFSIFLLSLLALIKYYETNKYKYLILSVILSAVTLLFYENYMTFVLFVILFILAKNSYEQGITFLKNKKTYKEALPFIFICIVYIVVYYLYRISVQTENGFYVGSTFAENFSISNFFNAISSFNGVAMPTYVYHHKQSSIEANSLLVAGHQYNFLYILKNSQPASIVNALIQCFLFGFLFSEMKPSISWKKIGAGILIILVFAFAVHAIVALSEKYNAEFYRMDGYVTTYYSYFCITALIMFFAYACLKASYENKYVKTVVIAAFTLFFFYISIIINYSNDHLSRDWQLSRGKHLMMEKVILEGLFDDISENAIIYMGNYNQTFSTFGHDIYASHPNFWTDYITTKTQKQLNVHINFENFRNSVQTDFLQEIYYITKYEARKSSDILLILSRVNSSSINFEDEESALVTAVTNEAKVYYYSANKEFIFLFVIPQCSQESTITIHNTTLNASCGINVLRIVNENKKKAITSFTLKSDDPFSVKDFAISNIGSLSEEVLYLHK